MSSKNSVQKWPSTPVTARIGSMVRPGVPLSGTAIVESPRCFGASQSVRARHRP